jgi:hypothetical protein
MSNFANPGGTAEGPDLQQETETVFYPSALANALSAKKQYSVPIGSALTTE